MTSKTLKPPKDKHKWIKDEDKPKPIFVLITETAVKVFEEGATDQPEFKKTGDGYDMEGVDKALKALKEARPERVQVSVKAEDSVKFDHIAQAIDLCTKYELTGLQLQPASQ